MALSVGARGFSIRVSFSFFLVIWYHAPQEHRVSLSTKSFGREKDGRVGVGFVGVTGDAEEEREKAGGGRPRPLLCAVAVCLCCVCLCCPLVQDHTSLPCMRVCSCFFLLLQPSQALLYEDSALYVPAGPDWVQQHWLYIAAGCGGVGILLGVVAGVVACRLHARKYRRRAAKFYKRQASGRLEVCPQPLWPGVCMSLHSGVRSTYGVCAGGFEGEEWGGGLVWWMLDITVA